MHWRRIVNIFAQFKLKNCVLFLYSSRFLLGNINDKTITGSSTSSLIVSLYWEKVYKVVQSMGQGKFMVSTDTCFCNLAFFSYVTLRHLRRRCSATDLSLMFAAVLQSLSPGTFMLKTKQACVGYWMQSVLALDHMSLFIICPHQSRQVVAWLTALSCPHKCCQVFCIEQYNTSEHFSDIIYFTFAYTFLKYLEEILNFWNSDRGYYTLT